MNFEQMSEKLQQIIVKAAEISRSYGHANVDTIQMLKAIFGWSVPALEHRQTAGIVDHRCGNGADRPCFAEQSAAEPGGGAEL